MQNLGNRRGYHEFLDILIKHLRNSVCQTEDEPQGVYCDGAGASSRSKQIRANGGGNQSLSENEGGDKESSEF